ncbi:hypothetical protein [Methylobacterium sp.]|uniref:hypothetical protein n=1 Tax=Methylobacterium sp. TaxID=409 RepID=UPI003B01E466
MEIQAEFMKASYERMVAQAKLVRRPVCRARQGNRQAARGPDEDQASRHQLSSPGASARETEKAIPKGDRATARSPFFVRHGTFRRRARAMSARR